MVPALLFVFSCRSVGPKSVVRDRNAYLNAISDSWKSQLLLNIVRIRYADAPVFLDVASIISQYEVSGSVSAGIALEQKGVGWNPSVNGTATFTDRPTITYSPLSGQKFALNLMKPLPPSIVLGLVYGGYPVDMVLRLTLNSLSGYRNSFGGIIRQHEASPEFFSILSDMKILQMENCMNLVGVRQGETDEHIELELEEHPDSMVMATVKHLNKLLNLPQENRKYRIGNGTHKSDSISLALATRSMIEILSSISASVEVPAEHADAGITFQTPYLKLPDGSLEKPFIRIQSSKEPPANAFLAVQYLGYWFYIDLRDYPSKQSFSQILILSSLSEVSDMKTTPVITIPTR